MITEREEWIKNVQKCATAMISGILITVLAMIISPIATPYNTELIVFVLTMFFSGVAIFVVALLAFIVHFINYFFVRPLQKSKGESGITE